MSVNRRCLCKVLNVLYSTNKVEPVRTVSLTIKHKALTQCVFVRLRVFVGARFDGAFVVGACRWCECVCVCVSLSLVVSVSGLSLDAESGSRQEKAQHHT